MKRDNKHRNMVLIKNHIKTKRINARGVKVARKTINVEFD